MIVSFQEARLRNRKTESEENLLKRLEAARVDMEFSKYWLFEHFFFWATWSV